MLVRTVRAAARWLGPGGGVLLELGGDQAVELASVVVDAGLRDIRVHRDDDGDVRGIEARLPEAP
jgi:methylase of polypeptide subunit release factors